MQCQAKVRNNKNKIASSFALSLTPFRPFYLEPVSQRRQHQQQHKLVDAQQQVEVVEIHGLGELDDGSLLDQLGEGGGEAAEDVGQGVDACERGGKELL